MPVVSGDTIETFGGTQHTHPLLQYEYVDHTTTDVSLSGPIVSIDEGGAVI